MPISPSQQMHEKWMRAALFRARKGMGMTGENPSVGCVLVKDGQLIAAARTANGGRPHAESQAIKLAGAQVKGATAYVTLEPCAHHGQTPPCAQALIDAGIDAVVIGCSDPNQRVNGKGIQMLKNADINVVTNILEQECQDVIRGFIMNKKHNRPFVTLKIAMTLDGKIATKNGDSQWITGERARRYGHKLRAENDAILIGVGTALADDPSLTCRLPGIEKFMTRIVLDSDLRIPADSQLVKTASENPVVVIHVSKANSKKREQLCEAGVECLASDNMNDVQQILSLLAAKGINNLLVEGGGHVHASFLRSDIWDELVCFTNASFVGGDGLSGVHELGIKRINDRLKFKRIKTHLFENDRLEIFGKAE